MNECWTLPRLPAAATIKLVHSGCQRTELMVLVTPYIVRAVARKDLSRPDDGFADASDPASDLLGRLNRIYGVAGHVEPTQPYHGKYGFILD